MTDSWCRWYRGQDHGTDDRIMVQKVQRTGSQNGRIKVQIVQRTGSWNSWKTHSIDGRIIVLMEGSWFI